MAINPIELQKRLKGVNDPASRRDLLSAAEAGAGRQQVLESLPDRDFEKPTNVTEALKNDM